MGRNMKLSGNVVGVAVYSCLIFFFYFLFIFDRDRAQVGEGQREGDTESETNSRLRADSTEPDAGLKLTNPEIMT